MSYLMDNAKWVAPSLFAVALLLLLFPSNVLGFLLVFATWSAAVGFAMWVFWEEVTAFWSRTVGKHLGGGDEPASTETPDEGDGDDAADPP